VYSDVLTEPQVNGAQFFYQRAFRIYIESDDKKQQKPMLVGLVNSAPYLACVASCWLSPWLNRRFGRRGAIFWSAIFSAAFAFAQAFSNTWQTLFLFRFLMGFGIGPKSATIPIYAAECSPANLRGSLVMLWQLFTAVGIMLGSISGVVLQDVGSSSDCSNLLSLKCSLNWRLMLASPMVAPIILAGYIYTQSESPRWLINEGHRLRTIEMPILAQRRYEQAWEALEKLRHEKVQAARDMFEIYHLLESERQAITKMTDSRRRSWTHRGVLQLFAVRRNRRATIASLVCMFAQQFCGV
jgi:MFS family permease